MVANPRLFEGVPFLRPRDGLIRSRSMPRALRVAATLAMNLPSSPGYFRAQRHLTYRPFDRVMGDFEHFEMQEILHITRQRIDPITRQRQDFKVVQAPWGIWEPMKLVLGQVENLESWHIGELILAHSELVGYMKLTGGGKWVNLFPLRLRYRNLLNLEKDMTIAPSANELYESANLPSVSAWIWL